jgi:hypothetical protein
VGRDASSVAGANVRPPPSLASRTCSTGDKRSATACSARPISRSTSRRWASTASSRSPRTGLVNGPATRRPLVARPDGRRSLRPAAAPAGHDAQRAPAPESREPRLQAATYDVQAPNALPSPARNAEEPLFEAALRAIKTGGDLLSQAVAHQVPSARRGLTALFGMGRGVSPSLWPPKSLGTAAVPAGLENCTQAKRVEINRQALDPLVPVC